MNSRKWPIPATAWDRLPCSQVTAHGLGMSPPPPSREPGGSATTRASPRCSQVTTHRMWQFVAEPALLSEEHVQRACKGQTESFRVVRTVKHRAKLSLPVSREGCGVPDHVCSPPRGHCWDSTSLPSLYHTKVTLPTSCVAH